MFLIDGLYWFASMSTLAIVAAEPPSPVKLLPVSETSQPSEMSAFEVVVTSLLDMVIVDRPQFSTKMPVAIGLIRPPEVPMVLPSIATS